MDEKHFELLLEILDPDRDTAGEKYVLLHHKIIFLAEREGYLSSKAEDMADETLSRVGKIIQKKKNEGKFKDIENINGFVFMTYKFILKEFRRKYPPTDELPPELEDALTPEEKEELRMDCLDKCLEKDLSEEEANLILNYYDPDADRQKIAEELKIEINYLKQKAFRIRKSLRNCINKCVERSTVTKRPESDTYKQGGKRDDER